MLVLVAFTVLLILLAVPAAALVPPARPEAAACMGREGAFDGLFKLKQRSDRSFLIANPVSSSPSGMFVRTTYTSKTACVSASARQSRAQCRARNTHKNKRWTDGKTPPFYA